MNLETIREQLRQGRLFYTRHAIQRMSKRGIAAEMVEAAILDGEIIEEYPDDIWPELLNRR